MGCGCGQTTTSGGYQLLRPDGTVLADRTGVAMTFATRAAAQASQARHGGTVIGAVRAPAAQNDPSGVEQ